MRNKSKFFVTIGIVAVAVLAIFGCGSPSSGSDETSSMVLMGSSDNSILIIDPEKETEPVKEMPVGFCGGYGWGNYATGVVGKKAIIAGGLILIVDSKTETIKELNKEIGGNYFSGANWGYDSVAVVGNKVVLGRGDHNASEGDSILIVDTKTDTVKEIKKDIGGNSLNLANWGFESTAVIENKIVMGPGNNGGSILIVDTRNDTVKEIKETEGGVSLLGRNWGYRSTVVVGNKVVMGRGDGGNSILIVDTRNDTAKEIKETEGSVNLSSADWGSESTVVVGDKVVMGRRDTTGGSILIVNTRTDTVKEIGGFLSARWGCQSTAIAGDKVVMGCGPSEAQRSILIVDTRTDTVNEIRIKEGGGNLTTREWGVGSTVAAGNKVVMGPGSRGTSILIIDTVAETVAEINVSNVDWGNNAMAAVGNKVVMGRGYWGTSILIVDAVAKTVEEVGGLSSSAAWGIGSTEVIGKGEAVKRIPLFAFIQKKYDLFMDYITQWWNEKKLFAGM